MVYYKDTWWFSVYGDHLRGMEYTIQDPEMDLNPGRTWVAYNLSVKSDVSQNVY